MATAAIGGDRFLLTYNSPYGNGQVTVNIWYITMSFPEPRETFAHCDIEALRRLGHRVEVHCLRGPHARRDQLVKHWGVSVSTEYHTPKSFLLGLIQALLCPAALLAALRCVFSGNKNIIHMMKGLALVPRTLSLLSLYRQKRPDVVHLFWGHFPSVPGYTIKSMFPDSVVTMFLGAYDLSTGFSGSARMAKVADAVFTHAKVNIPAIVARGTDQSKVVLAYRGVDPGNLELAIPPKIRGRIISIGMLEEQKGMLRVLEVFKKVQASHPDSSLRILGEGEEQRALERFVDYHRLRNVEIAGYVPHKNVMAELLEAEALLFLSDFETERLPNAVKEAVAADCLCVVSRTPGIEELIPQDGGFIVSAYDIPAACAAVARAFSDREGAMRMRRKATMNLRRHFNAGVNMKIYTDRWSELTR